MGVLCYMQRSFVPSESKQPPRPAAKRLLLWCDQRVQTYPSSFPHRTDFTDYFWDLFCSLFF